MTTSSEAPRAASIDELRSHPFFKGLKEEHLARLAPQCSFVELAAGTLMLKQGDPATSFFLIVSGMVTLTHAGLHRNVPIQTLGAGDAVGWSWLFPPYAWHFNAMAVEAVRALRFDGQALREICGQDRDLGYEIMLRITQVVIERLQKTRQKFYKLT
jgi:CRP/FNR family transcriptional regulator, cyclic AMP receptor protein